MTTIILGATGLQGPRGPAGAPPTGRIITGSENVQMVASDGIVEIAQDVPAAIIVTSPVNPVPFQIYTIKDGAGNASAFPITLTPNAGLIDGNSIFVINTNWSAISFYFNGTDLRIV